MHTHDRSVSWHWALLSLAIVGFLVMPSHGRVWISEIVADNDGSFLDDDGQTSDWIELFNDGDSPVDLSGWSLTDDELDLRKWVFPSGTTLSSKGFLVVFASKENRRVQGFPLHTNFSLSKDGEYLALVQADGSTTQQEFDPFPAQSEGASYGHPQSGGANPMVLAGEAGLATYFAAPTPGLPNDGPTESMPPRIVEATNQVATRPVGGAGSAPIPVTAEVRKGLRNIAQVQLFHRIMFGPEAAPIDMRDEGLNGDALAGDGIYTALLPTTGLQPGQMIRWRIEATDTAGAVSTLPLVTDPLDSDVYFGTVATDPSLATSQLTILETFVDDEDAVDTREGGRVSVFYLNEFYDNVQMDLHGQSTAEFPKKSYDLDFNKNNRFRWQEGERRVKDINLLTNWADKSKARNTVAYDFFRKAGATYHYAFPIRMQRNGEFFSTTDLVEDGDDRFLERVGLDEDGALYKMYDGMVDVEVASKQTRREEGNTDLQEFYDGIRLTGSSQRRYLYDNVNIPATINHLAALITATITDTGHKNYYMYRDTEGTGEWWPLPWDMDLSAGRQWNPVDTYFDDTLKTQAWNFVLSNPLWEVMHTNDDFRPMFLRRFRTLREEVLGPAGVNPDWYADRFREVRDLVDPPGVAVSDADLDYNKWGSWGNNATVQQASNRILTQWLPARRDYLFSEARQQNGESVPRAQRPNPSITIDTVEALPTSGNPKEEYLILANNESSAIDLSGWTLTGGIRHTFAPGTVIMPGNGTSISGYKGLLHLAKDATAFRGRTLRPRGSEFRLIQGGYDGFLSARGEELVLTTDKGIEVARVSFPGTPTEWQEFLRITRINYHPADPTAAEEAAQPGVTSEDFEYLILRNIGGVPLDLGGLTFNKGIEYTFANGVFLADGAAIVIAKNPAAVVMRYPELTDTIVGPFLGALDNGGEELRLADTLGENVFNFTYDDRWFPDSDGRGGVLVVRDELIDPRLLDEPLSWLNMAEDGSTETHFNAWQAQNFASSAFETTGMPNADPDGDGLLNWQEYALVTDPLTADSPLFESVITASGGKDYLAATVRRRSSAADLVWELQASQDLLGWSEIPATVASLSPHGDGTETVTLRAPAPTGTEDIKFVRLLLTLME